MTITQLEYVLAVAQTKNFRKAAEYCHVTQPTLSVQISKLEEELEVILFDRSKSPITPTLIGQKLIFQAKSALTEVSRIHEVIDEEKGLLRGDLSIGIIPTISPYLLPLFLKPFHNKYPELNLKISEMTTCNCLKSLEDEEIDVAILATKEDPHKFNQNTLYTEDMLLFLNPNNSLSNAKNIPLKSLKAEEMWLLEDGHCLRDEVISVCHLQKQMNLRPQNLDLKVGNLESLRYLVEENYGYTLLPYLSTLRLNPKEKKMVRSLEPQNPQRTIRLTSRRKHLKRMAIEHLKKTIQNSLPKGVLTPQ